jgi:hypothetical protein
MELGIYFGKRKPFHKYTIDDVYLILSSFVNEYYSHDKFLKELIALDYYLHFKVKPKNLIIDEVNRIEKSSIINALALNHHKYRFIILKISFNLEHFIATGEVIKYEDYAAIQYDGENKAKLLVIDKSEINVA